ncbi:hypothetical protein NP493_23g05038 [Ridgeia piscesae]|uniref:Uncharacterized protein n=1 Tax=Ridgeia piscesae TaxID=27915 RepID=A0AAD9PDG7_RIDPI|nr:hypothetical protein NP493_23g05038 [Ridgeia piscesae]
MSGVQPPVAGQQCDTDTSDQHTDSDDHGQLTGGVRPAVDEPVRAGCSGRAAAASPLASAVSKGVESPAPVAGGGPNKGEPESSSNAVANSSTDNVTYSGESSMAEHETSCWTSFWRDRPVVFDEHAAVVDTSEESHHPHSSNTEYANVWHVPPPKNTNELSVGSTDCDDGRQGSSGEDRAAAMLAAIETNDIDRVCVLLLQGANVNRPYNSRSPLCVAAQAGHASLVDVLLATNTCVLDQPDLSDSVWHRHAVHYAAVRGHVGIVQKLITTGVDVNTRDGDNRTPLHWAATSGWVNVAEFLIANGASVNIVQKDGFSALHAATCLGHMHMCRFLLAEGAEVNRTDRDGWSPLHMATCYGHPEVVRLFLSSGAKVNQRTRDEETALHIAVDPANLDIIGDLISAGARLEGRNINGFTPFFDAVWRNKYTVCKYLIDMGADVNVKNNAGHSAMYIATVRAAKSFMKLIVAAGCDLQAEAWIRLGQVPVALTEHTELCDWLYSYTSQPHMLQTVACLIIRKCLRSNITAKVVLLPVPDRLKNFIALRYL